ncbi:DUF6927 domain-containing protein [Roseomonas mucosa]
MGWLVSDRPLTHETPAAYLSREFTCANETNRTEVLAASQVKGAVYLAVRHTSLTGERAGRSYVFCAVVLVFNNARQGFGRKTMDESCGPCEVDCPARIMALLSPIEDIPNPGYAADWRARVAAAAALRREATASGRNLDSGQRISLTQQISFDGGRVVTSEFEVVPTPPGRRGPIFRPVGHDFLCRVPRHLLATAMHVAGGAADTASRSMP